MEWHTAVRFVRLRKHIENYTSHIQPLTHPLAVLRAAYNLVFWVFLLPFFTGIDYRVGFIAFTIVIFVRLLANLYANNIMEQTPQHYEQYPLRLPLEAS